MVQKVIQNDEAFIETMVEIVIEPTSCVGCTA